MQRWPADTKVQRVFSFWALSRRPSEQHRCGAWREETMELKYSDGLIPAVIQDRHSGKVLMLGYMNDEAYRKTLASGFVTFFSRSRQELWTKGETSGHRLKVREIRVDCDQDALLIQADLTGPGCCHLGYKSCFFRKLTEEGEEIILTREFDPAEVYGDAEQESQT
jgi:phosphoribosyl-AMP cyclohydrolase